MRWGSAVRTGIGALALVAASAMPARAQQSPVVDVYQDVDLTDQSPGVRLGSWGVPSADGDRRALFAHLMRGNDVQSIFTYDQQGSRTGTAVLHVPEGFSPEIGTFDPAGARYASMASQHGGPLITALEDNMYRLDIHGALDLELAATGNQSMCLPIAIVDDNDRSSRIEGYLSISEPSIRRWTDDQGKETEHSAPPPMDCPQEYERIVQSPPDTTIVYVDRPVPVAPFTALAVGAGYKMGIHDQWTEDCSQCIDFDGPALTLAGAYLSREAFARADLLGMKGDGEPHEGDGSFDVTVLNGRAIATKGSSLAVGVTGGGLSFSADGVKDVDFTGGYLGATVGKRFGSDRSAILPSVGVGGVSAGDASGIALLAGVDAITSSVRGGVGGAVFREGGFTNALVLGRASVPLVGSLELWGDMAWAPVCYDDFHGDDHLQGALGLQYRF